jgi:hypothetical protein
MRASNSAGVLTLDAFSTGCHVHDDRLPLLSKAEDVHHCPSTLAIPEHEADRRFLRHSATLGRVVVEVAPLPCCPDRPDRPVADVVARRLVGTDLHEAVGLLTQVGLHGAVDAVGVSGQYRETLLGNSIEPNADLGAQSRESPRTADEHPGHWLLRVRVSVRT